MILANQTSVGCFSFKTWLYEYIVGLWVQTQYLTLWHYMKYTHRLSRITLTNLCLYFLKIFCFYARACFTWASVVWAIHPYVHSCLTCIWPSCTLPAVLTLVCVDSKHSCRSQRPRSGRTRGCEGQCWRGDGAQRESDGRKWKAEKEGKAVLSSGHWEHGRRMP